MTEGQPHIGESMLTGEPVPVLKSRGDAVSTGTLATTGTLNYCATHVGRGTVMARIKALTKQAQAARLQVEELINKITGWFVPGVLVIAVTTLIILLFWASLVSQ